MVVLSYSLEKDVEIKKKFNIKGKNIILLLFLSEIEYFINN